MKCVNCGADIPSDTMNCIYCGHSVQMVPDYNPLGDVLEEEVRSRIDENEKTASKKPVETRNSRSQANQRDTRNLAAQRDAKEGEAKKRREFERRKALKKKRRNLVIGILLSIVIVIILVSYLIYINSYTGQMNSGSRALDNGSYAEAIEHYENAMDKKPLRDEPYNYLIYIYTIQGDIDSIEAVYLEALDVNSNNIDMNIGLMEFYVENNQQYKITSYLETIDNENVKEALLIYESVGPEFSLEAGTYDDVQELTISSDTGDIYYTLDGTTPDENSILYESAIQISEGTSEVSAIAINEKGVISNVTQGTYIVALPVPDAPIVSPSTGQYNDNTYITVSVPDGATAYYTTDGTHPYDNEEPSSTATKYKTSIEMPEGNTILSVVIVSASGKVSDVTMRNYELIIEEEPEEDIEDMTSEDVTEDDSI